MQTKLKKRYTSWEFEQVKNLLNCLCKEVCGSYEPPITIKMMIATIFSEARERKIEFAHTIDSGQITDAKRRHKKEIVTAIANFVEKHSYIINLSYSRWSVEELHLMMLEECRGASSHDA